MKCVAGRADPAGRNAQATPRRLRGVRVPGGRHFELVVIGALDRPVESLPAVAQLADCLGSAGEDRVMSRVGDVQPLAMVRVPPKRPMSGGGPAPTLYASTARR